MPQFYLTDLGSHLQGRLPLYRNEDSVDIGGPAERPSGGHTRGPLSRINPVLLASSRGPVRILPVSSAALKEGEEEGIKFFD